METDTCQKLFVCLQNHGIVDAITYAILLRLKHSLGIENVLHIFSKCEITRRSQHKSQYKVQAQGHELWCLDLCLDLYWSLYGLA
jgi:hypothetical protein